ncbi:UPF0235 protein [Agaricicola taiwanensis]|uniref:UPF0235 protein GCM10007276_01330 n=1 Tax=Agaricicola taiwanensis TaxID=591372 RepID=A0A8J2VEZ3_9RHOB|nr:DUF167 family protein [Agaricicola taiwanensis]GGE27891.1 UPF0235 protein [Agaricicola taiwanensis]
MTAWTATGRGIRLRVRLTPRGGRDAIEGIEDRGGEEIVKARVAAPPEDGKANAALCRLLAKELKIAPSRILVEAGATARIKTIGIAGEASSLIAAVEAKFGKDRT